MEKKYSFIFTNPVMSKFTKKVIFLWMFQKNYLFLHLFFLHVNV